MSRKTDASSPSGGIQVAQGMFTGDGAATQAIVGVGFQPRFVIIQPTEYPAPSETPLAFKSDQDGLLAFWYWSGGATFRYDPDQIISLDADGFTVGDGTGSAFEINVLNTDYSYCCFR